MSFYGIVKIANSNDAVKNYCPDLFQTMNNNITFQEVVVHSNFQNLVLSFINDFMRLYIYNSYQKFFLFIEKLHCLKKLTFFCICCKYYRDIWRKSTILMLDKNLNKFEHIVWPESSHNWVSFKIKLFAVKISNTFHISMSCNFKQQGIYIFSEWKCFHAYSIHTY